MLSVSQQFIVHRTCFSSTDTRECNRREHTRRSCLEYYRTRALQARMASPCTFAEFKALQWSQPLNGQPLAGCVLSGFSDSMGTGYLRAASDLLYFRNKPVRARPFGADLKRVHPFCGCTLNHRRFHPFIRGLRDLENLAKENSTL